MAGRFDSQVRRAIRKAERSNVNALVARSRQAIDDFYRLHVQTRRRHGLPPQPASFFLNIYEHIIKPGLGFIVLARRGSRPIAAAVFFRFGKNAVYKYGASDKRFQEFRANNLVMWQGIQHSGADWRRKITFRPHRLRKRRFATIQAFLGHARRNNRLLPSRSIGSAVFHLRSAVRAALHKRIFGRLPLAFNRLAGSILYPHLD